MPDSRWSHAGELLHLKSKMIFEFTSINARSLCHFCYSQVIIAQGSRGVVVYLHLYSFPFFFGRIENCSPRQAFSVFSNLEATIFEQLLRRIIAGSFAS